MQKILFVCLGNICRSPLADGLLRNKVKNLNQNIEVDSCGTANYHVGEKPDSRIISTAKKYNTDISFLKARQFSIHDFETFDYIFVMDKSNYNNICSLTKNINHLEKVHLFLKYISFPNIVEVPDPYYGTQVDFDNCYSILNKATDMLVEKLFLK